MPAPRFRIWFGDRAASEDELRRVEEIDVVQEMDAFWEAHIRMALCLDANGRWLHWPGDRAQPFSRVRIELDGGDGRFAALIDGPLVAIDAGLDAQPGHSTASLVVRDDSAFMNVDETTGPPYEYRTDSSIAEELFGGFEQIGSLRIDATTATPKTTARRGTALQFLRELAQANDRHAYVLPGAQRGASIGCFARDPEGAGDLPPLVLVGAKRNLANATIAQDPDGAERTQAAVLRVDDQGVTTLESTAEDLGLMRELPALPLNLTPRRLLHPYENTREDPGAAADAQTRRRSYVYRLSSRVLPGCYGSVLSPYRKVRVDAGATPYSGDYLITRVAHRITPSQWTQEIEAKTDSATAVSAAPVAEALGGGVKLAVSANVGIF